MSIFPLYCIKDSKIEDQNSYDLDIIHQERPGNNLKRKEKKKQVTNNFNSKHKEEEKFLIKNYTTRAALNIKETCNTLYAIVKDCMKIITTWLLYVINNIISSLKIHIKQIKKRFGVIPSFLAKYFPYTIDEENTKNCTTN